MVLHWGICSAGNIASDFTNGILLAKEHNKVVAIASRNLERAKQFAGEFNIVHFYGSYEELANDPQVDIVYIGAIHPEHHKLALLFLTSKKHVLCEKPLSLSLKLAQEMVNTAKSNGVFFMEGYWSRFFPVYQEIKKELKKGTIGNIIKINASFDAALESPRSHEKQLGGGGLLDIGCYPLQFALWAIPQRPKSWSIDGACHPQWGTDVTGNITLHFEGDQVAYLTYHNKCAGSTAAAIYGDAGSIKIKDFFWAPTEMTVNDEVRRFDLPTESVRPYNYNNSAGFMYEVEHVRKCIEAGQLESDLVSHSDSLLIMEIMESLLKTMGVSYDLT